MSRGRILLLENIHVGAKNNLEAHGFDVELLPKALPEADLKKAAQGCVAIGIRSKSKLTRPVLEAIAGSTRAIGAFCIGTNQIDLTAATELGIATFNAPFSNTRSVAEMVMCEVVGLSRKLFDRSAALHEGRWTKSAEGSHEIRGKTLGIIGYGHIGRQVGVLAEAFGMSVIFYDIAARLAMGNNRVAKDLNGLLAESDFVTLHVPETPQTKEMIGAAELAAMKRGAFLINASRGTVVVIPALAEAIKSGHVGGAAIDVFPEEPEGNDGVFKSEIQKLPNVILTPHVGGSTVEAQVSIGQEVSETLARFLGTGNTTGSVNFPIAELMRHPGSCRIVHVHKNVPGVLRDVNRTVSEAEANVVGQVLSTDPTLGYLLMDVEARAQIGGALVERLRALPTTVRADLIE